MKKEVGQKYRVIKDEMNGFDVGEIVTLAQVSGKISLYSGQCGKRRFLIDIDHENPEVELIKEKGDEYMENLKAGDLLVCIDNEYDRMSLTRGGEYRATNTLGTMVRVINDKGKSELYYSKRFKLANETTKGESMNNIKKLHKEIKNIYFNEEKRTTVIVFKNGDKVKATSSKDTPFSEYAGFVTALFKYEHGLKLKDVEHLIKKKRG